ncbi:MAG: MBL fold metallo-hydrolase [Lachnospiraceae bacterium]|nr:MBL fold metallo-hydrolase [Lachnospiraceae bacterium]
MVRFFSLASGSSGNSIYVGTERTGILVDAGISAKKLEGFLLSQFIRPEDLSGILITHEHGDHVGGLPVFLKRYPVPVYATAATISYIRHMKGAENLSDELFHAFRPGDEITFDGITVQTCKIMHDAKDPVAYSFLLDGKKIGMATDLGCITPEVVKHLSDADLLYLESNYDRYMLLAGPYPYPLKQRIMGDRGHLSNEDSARLVSHVIHEKLRCIVLAHLSKENNVPDLALITMKNELDGAWNYDIPKPRLVVAPRDVPMDVITL